MTDVTLRQLIRFCASGVLDTPTVDPATDEHQIARLREADGADLPDEESEP